MLANREGFMCCLGQISCQAGVPYKAVIDVASPNGIDDEHNRPITSLFLSARDTDNQNKLAWEAMRINDHSKLTGEEREAKLSALFALHGHTLTFTGEFIGGDKRACIRQDR
jgi:hypothetical protein